MFSKAILGLVSKQGTPKLPLGVEFWAEIRKSLRPSIGGVHFSRLFTKMTKVNASEESVHLKLLGALGQQGRDFAILEDDLECF